MRHKDREPRRCTQSWAGLSVLGLSKTRVCRIARWVFRLKAQTHKTRLAGDNTGVRKRALAAQVILPPGIDIERGEKVI